MKRLSHATIEEVQAEMSNAGDPEKVTDIMVDMLVLTRKVDKTNPAELINLELAVKRILAEVKLMKREYERRTGQKIS